MKDELKKHLTTDDLAWVSIKLNSHYVAVKKSDALTDEEKQVEIEILCQRALRFGLTEIAERMGYLVWDIQLGEGKEARIVVPHSHKKEAFEAILKHLEILQESKTPKP